MSDRAAVAGSWAGLALAGGYGLAWWSAQGGSVLAGAGAVLAVVVWGVCAAGRRRLPGWGTAWAAAGSAVLMAAAVGAAGGGGPVGSLLETVGAVGPAASSGLGAAALLVLGAGMVSGPGVPGRAGPVFGAQVVRPSGEVRFF